MDHLLYLLLGWLLGLLSPGIAERIRRKHRQADIIATVIGELLHLQYTMGVVALLTRSHLGALTDEFLDWFQPILHLSAGLDADPQAVEAIARLRRETPEEQRRQMLAAAHDQSLNLPQYSLPFLTALAGEIAICPLEFQLRVLRIKGQLDRFNQQVLFLQTQYEKTFDASITDDNREAVESNLQEGYEQLAGAAQLIADAVSEVTSAWGRSNPPNQGMHPAAQKPGGG